MKSSLILKTVGQIVVFGGVGTGGYLVIDHYIPKTIGDGLRMEGIMVPPSDDVPYKVAYVDYLNEIKTQAGIEDTTDTTQATQKIKTGCQGKIDSKYDKSQTDSYENIKKYCVGIPKTLKGVLVKNNKFDITKNTTDDEYKTTFAVYKYNSDFLNIFSGSDSVTQSTGNDQGKEKLKSWCESKLSENASMDTNILNNILGYCFSLGYSTVEEKLKKDGVVVPSFDDSSDSEKGKTKFNTGKYTTDVLNSVKGSDTAALDSNTDESQGGTKIKNWCKEGMSKKLSDSGVYKDEYLKLKSVCIGS